jgi:hypothetical protein
MSYYIYKICCDDLPDFVYVGSTKAFRQRKMSHKKDCKNENSSKFNLKLYTTIRENGGWDNWRMVIIEDCGEITFTQARIKEEEYRVKLNANLNSQKCKGNKKEYNKEYRENNKELILKSQQKTFICECGMELKVGSKSRHLQRRIHKKLIEEKNNI